MGKIIFKPGADIPLLRQKLRQKGYIIEQRLPDGSYVIYKKLKKHETNDNQALQADS